MGNTHITAEVLDTEDSRGGYISGSEICSLVTYYTTSIKAYITHTAIGTQSHLLYVANAVTAHRVAT